MWKVKAPSRWPGINDAWLIIYTHNIGLTPLENGAGVFESRKEALEEANKVIKHPVLIYVDN